MYSTNVKYELFALLLMCGVRKDMKVQAEKLDNFIFRFWTSTTLFFDNFNNSEELSSLMVTSHQDVDKRFLS